ncbi:MAG TPA: twin-arginine translocase TatA/TatE family subunit [Cellulomonas sp.]
MLDINGGEFLVILLVAVIVVGPSRLPHYAEELGKLVRRARSYLRDARERIGDELGEDAKDIDWEALDPRRYDPRRIVRDALLDPDPTDTRGPARAAGGARAPYRTGAAATGAAGAAAGDEAGSVPGAAAGAGPTPSAGPTPGTGAGTAPSASGDPSPPAPFDDEAT